MQNQLASLPLPLQQQTQQNQNQSQNQLPLANYTLPGVINYLTSEFTNLERYKIMNNLEKSEMKYKINHLQGEVNSLKYINERQASKIAFLEKENTILKQKLDSKASAKKEEFDLTALSTELPEIDLLVVKNSRERLTRAMKEVAYLLRAPTPNGYQYLNLPESAIADDNGVNNDGSQYDELFSTQAHENDKEKEKHRHGFSQYLGSNTSLGSSLDSSIKSIDNGDLFHEIGKMQEKASKESGHVKSIEDENDLVSSDGETVIYDNEDEFSFSKEGVRSSPPIQQQPPQQPQPTTKAGYSSFKQSSNADVNESLQAYINYNPGSSRGWLSVYDIKNATVIASADLASEDQLLEDILEVYCLNTATIQVLVIYNNASLELFTLHGNTAKLNAIQKSNVKVTSAIFTQISKLQAAIAYAITEEKIPQVQVFQITLDSTPKLKDLGVFESSLFGAFVSELEVVSWNKPPKNQRRNSAVILTDPIVKANDKLFKIKLSDKTIEGVTSKKVLEGT